MVASGRGAENGILFRDSEALENTKKLTTILLDKTGTITAGQPTVIDIHAAPGLSERDVLRWAASAESASEHPLALAILAHAKAERIDVLPLADFEAIPGRGLQATVADKAVLVGNPALMDARGIDASPLANEIARQQAQARTVVLVAVDGALLGALAIGDELKPSSAAAIAALKSRGLNVVMVTGDNAQTADAIAGQVGIKRVYAGILPADKAAVVRDLQDQGETVAMVGDGINDAPALAQADVGLAIGTGTDIAIESSDVTLISGDLNGVVSAIDLSQRTMRAIYQNLFWAFIYNILLIPVAMLGGLIPMFAAAAMAFSSVLVVTNSLRLRTARVAP